MLASTIISFEKQVYQSIIFVFIHVFTLLTTRGQKKREVSKLLHALITYLVGIKKTLPEPFRKHSLSWLQQIVLPHFSPV